MAQLSDLNFTMLSHELLCHIISFLPLKDILHVAVLCKKLNNAVSMYLHLCKKINLTDDRLFEYLPSSITDENLSNLFKKCSHLKVIYGLHPRHVEHRKVKKQALLTVPGIIRALQQCVHLQAVEISNLYLMENILRNLPHVKILGHFRNHDGMFPPSGSYKLKLPAYSNISSLHLTGVKVMELTMLPQLEHLYLQWVCFIKPHPFQLFSAPNLKTFVMRHTIGPDINLRYLPLIIALSSSTLLERLELIRVPILGGMIKRAVENSWQNGGFCKLHRLVISDCKDILEADIGNLIIVASHHLEHLALQPSLTKNSLFVSLSYAQCCFTNLKSLHLGFKDELPADGEWSEELLVGIGLADASDLPCLITDTGMKVISQIFPNLKSLSMNNCIHLTTPHLWCTEGTLPWKLLTDLIIRHCTHLRLPSFTHFLANLESVDTLILEDVFRESPNTYNHTCCKEYAVDDVLEKQMEKKPNDLQNKNNSFDDSVKNLSNANNEKQNSKIKNKKRKLNNSEENIYHASTSGIHHEENTIDCNLNNEHQTITTKTIEKYKNESCDFNKNVCICNFDTSGKISPKKDCLICFPQRETLKRKLNETNFISQGTQTLNSFVRQYFPSSFNNNEHNCLTCSSDYLSETVQYTDDSNNENKSTDTNDLVLLSNCNQVFYLSSKTLISITIISCGITDIIVDYSPNILHIDVSACRILKRIKMNICPLLLRLGITKCPKLSISFLIDNILNIPSVHGRIVYYEPFEKVYDQKLTEKFLFNNENLDSYIYLFHDYNSDDDYSRIYRERVLEWIQFLVKINRMFLKSENFDSKNQWKQQSLSNLWKYISNINGLLINGKYNLLSNNPFLKELWFSQELSNQDLPEIPICEFNKIQEILAETIPELKENKEVLLHNHVGFYIHVKDKNI